jgi:hypothetical protein
VLTPILSLAVLFRSGNRQKLAEPSQEKEGA